MLLLCHPQTILPSNVYYLVPNGNSKGLISVGVSSMMKAISLQCGLSYSPFVSKLMDKEVENCLPTDYYFFFLFLTVIFKEYFQSYLIGRTKFWFSMQGASKLFNNFEFFFLYIIKESYVSKYSLGSFFLLKYL